MRNTPKGYKRFIAIGCSHGSLVDRKAFDTVMRFSRGFKPHTKIHLGDICDYAAFRGGARGTKDEAEALGPDIRAGAELIREFSPTDVLIGNHDVRVWNLSNHPNALISLAASTCRQEFLTACEKAKVKRLIDHYDINRSWIQFGDTKFLHGFMYGENAIRDHAEHFGRCVIAHLHQPGSVQGRRSDRPTAHCVGTLANIPSLYYAATRRSTARWAHGFAYGEYNDHECHVWISQSNENKEGSWPLPL